MLLMATDAEKGLSHTIRVWVEEIRAPFLTASIIPIILGTAIAWETSGQLHLFYFIVTLLGGICLHAGTNVANDYFDHMSRDDDINKEFVRPFSGGSRLIQKGILSPRMVLFGSLILFFSGSIMGLYLVYARGLPILYLGLVGIFCGFFYTAPPFKLSHRGVGELIVGLNFGVLMTLGAYYVQTQRFALEPLFASLATSFLIAAVLYINQFPDYTADKTVGKHHLVVRLGKKMAARGYVLLLAATYLSILLGVLLGIISPATLLGFLTIPQAVRAAGTALHYYDDTPRLIPANAATVMIHLETGLLMSIGYIADKLLLR
jgi:1,4-dihydroxy-2-naphthoate octaprenyltransferase